MSNGIFLSQAFATISSRSAEIEEKIERLQQAKEDIIQEQSFSMTEIKKIEQPTLDELWTGNRADDFDVSREEAYETMLKIVEDYDDYVRTIDMKISILQAQKAAMDAAGSIARQAEQLLGKGEEALTQLNEKINDLKGRLFS